MGWLKGFLGRHAYLKQKTAQMLEFQRAKALTPDRIRKFYKFLQGLYDANHYESIWSADEIGFSQADLEKLGMNVIGCQGSAGNVLIPEWAGRVTMLGVVSHTMEWMPPFWIYEGILDLSMDCHIYLLILILECTRV